jgi:hypothetical protein
MIDEEALADGGARVNLRPSAEPRHLRDEPGQYGDLPQPEPVGDPMELPGMKPGVGEQYLQRVHRCRIMLKDRSDISSNADEMGHE